MWDYEDVDGYQPILHEQLRRILNWLPAEARGPRVVGSFADTRSVHRWMFLGLTPKGYDYFAGHYRGESFRCLQYYEVGVGGDSRVGCPSGDVAGQMSTLGNEIRTGVAALDAGVAASDGQVPREDKLLYAVSLAARLFQWFLTIHPYANGNGHIGRYIVLAVLVRCGFWPKHWTVDPRPGRPGYAAAIMAHRNGQPEALEEFILNCLR